ncbi:MAG: NAD(P)-dependent alcohol dehydrogenase [Actinomycetota bacterium]
MDITAAVVRNPEAGFGIEQLELGEPGPGEVLVRLVATGLCHTDFVVLSPEFPALRPMVAGHEGAGVVEALGPGVDDLAIGDEVILSFDSCGTCPNCRSGAPAYCDRFYELNLLGGGRPDGSTAFSSGDEAVHSHWFGQSSFATHTIASVRSCVRRPADVVAPLEICGPLGCGIQTGAGAVLNVLDPPAGSTLVVHGVGAVGLAAVMAGAIASCGRIIAVDLQPERLALARELGATDVIDAASTDDVTAAILELTGGRGTDASFDTTGIPAVIAAAALSLAPRGTLALVGVGDPAATIDTSHLMFGRSIRGVIEGDAVPQVFIPELLAHHAAGRFPFDRLIERYPLADINSALASSAAGGSIKPLLTMG